MAAKMKKLIIETVNNGWLVRPYPSDCSITKSHLIYVFTCMEELQKELPRIIAYYSNAFDKTKETLPSGKSR